MSAEVVNPDWFGFIGFTILVVCFVFVILAALLGNPRKPKLALVFIGTIFFLLTAFIMATWAGGAFFSLIIPE